MACYTYALATLLTSLLLATAQLHAKVVELDQFQITQNMSRWVADYSRKISQNRTAEDGLPYVECRPIAEVKSTYYCLYPTRMLSNVALNRVHAFIEGFEGVDKFTLVPFSNPAYKKSLDWIGAHALPAQDLAQFFNTAQELCNEDVHQCLSAPEKDIFENLILPHIQQDKNFVALASGVDRGSWAPSAAHEILHAQYYTDLQYRRAVDNFWQNKMTDKQRSEIRNLLPGYNTLNEPLMKDEFQAYFLQSGAECFFERDVVKKYREPLMQAMQSAGLQPIQIHIDTDELRWPPSYCHLERR